MLIPAVEPSVSAPSACVAFRSSGLAAVVGVARAVAGRTSTEGGGIARRIAGRTIGIACLRSGA